MSKNTKSYTLIKYEGRFLKIKGKKDTYNFQVYKLEDYNFETQLRFTKNEQAGVYIFTKRKDISKIDTTTIGGLTNWVYKATHQLLYCGRTDDLNGRFEKHHKSRDLVKADFNCLTICECNTHQKAEEIEKDLLAEHNFKFNEILNNWEPTMEEVVSEVH